MATLEELEERAAQATEGEFEEGDAEASPMLTDLTDGCGLLERTMHLLAYFGDTSLQKSVHKRDRVVMADMAEEIREYLDAVEGQYE
jgi:hypothetical protein